MSEEIASGCEGRRSCRGFELTAMQDDVIDHVVLVLGLVEAEGAAEVPLMRGSRLPCRVTHLHVHF